MLTDNCYHPKLFLGEKLCACTLVSDQEADKRAYRTWPFKFACDVTKVLVTLVAPESRLRLSFPPCMQFGWNRCMQCLLFCSLYLSDSKEKLSDVLHEGAHSAETPPICTFLFCNFPKHLGWRPSLVVKCP